MPKDSDKEIPEKLRQFIERIGNCVQEHGFAPCDPDCKYKTVCIESKLLYLNYVCTKMCEAIIDICKVVIDQIKALEKYAEGAEKIYQRYLDRQSGGKADSKP
jgi:hypothetical protein